MAKNASKKTDASASASGDLSPNDALAQKVIAALVEANLISSADGEAIAGRLAAGTLDEATWKLVFENQIERKEAPDGRK